MPSRLIQTKSLNSWGTRAGRGLGEAAEDIRAGVLWASVRVSLKIAISKLTLRVVLGLRVEESRQVIEHGCCKAQSVDAIENTGMPKYE